MQSLALASWLLCQTGTVAVTTVPSPAALFVDGRPSGHTPRQLSLTRGHHHLGSEHGRWIGIARVDVGDTPLVVDIQLYPPVRWPKRKAPPPSISWKAVFVGAVALGGATTIDFGLGESPTSFLPLTLYVLGTTLSAYGIGRSFL